MPILSHIGSRHPKVRALHLMVYLVLIGGSVVMVYPFLLMLAGSTKSDVDMRDMHLLPRFLVDDTALYRKHVEALFNERLAMMQSVYNTDAIRFGDVAPPAESGGGLERQWTEFLDQADLPPTTYALGYLEANVSKTLPLKLRTLKKELVQTYDGDVAAMNRALGAEFVNWNAFFVVPDEYLLRRDAPAQFRFAEATTAFKRGQSLAWRYYFVVEGFYKTMFLKQQYTRDIAQYNRDHGTRHASYDDVRLPRTRPEGTALEQQDWETFVRNTLNLLWIRVAEDARPDYQEFLRAKYGAIDILNRNYASSYAGFADIPLIAAPPDRGLALSDWNAFITGWKDPATGTLHTPRAEHLRVHSIELMFRDFLEARFPDLGELNRTLDTAFTSYEQILPPQQQVHYRAFLDMRGLLRREFAIRNYAAVIDFMLLHGRGIVNTLIYCLLAVMAALIVNPAAAYAMSRFRLPNTYKILLFMLLTMAFPPMVTQIPVFLMLRDLNLLNTFAALVLPGLAYGYSIFLLKGFFDSLPRELYESAEMDGAGEWVMFWTITMSLSKPILAVVALQAFTLAYSNFMFALLICQDESMWTLMVWLYQLQQRSGQGVLYASLIIASVPTLIIFLFCQNIIMRGIVVPVEK